MSDIVMQRKRALGPRNMLEARLWARLRALREQGWHFRKSAPFKTFTLDFVEHEARLVIDLLQGEPGHRTAPIHTVRDRLLNEQGYVILRLWRAEAERDLHSAVHKVREILDAHSTPETR
jgi:crossover junction endodeoxyribonuclease RuvC